MIAIQPTDSKRHLTVALSDDAHTLLEAIVNKRSSVVEITQMGSGGIYGVVGLGNRETDKAQESSESAIETRMKMIEYGCPERELELFNFIIYLRENFGEIYHVTALAAERVSYDSIKRFKWFRQPWRRNTSLEKLLYAFIALIVAFGALFAWGIGIAADLSQVLEALQECSP